MAAHETAGEMPAPEIRNGVLGYVIDGRFIPRMAGGETPPNPGEGDPPKGDGDGDTGKDGKPFDAARAQATIDALRAEIKAGKTTAKEADTLRARLKEIEDKDKSEVERLAGSAKEAGEKLTAAEARARDLAIRLAVAETASTIGIAGASVKAAVRLLDHGALTFDEDTGEPTNVEAALKALVKEYPMLAAEADPKKPAAERGTPGTPKPGGKAPTRDELIAEHEKKLAATGQYARM